MYLEQIMFGVLIIASLALVGMVAAGVVMFRNSEMNYKKRPRKKREYKNRLK